MPFIAYSWAVSLYGDIHWKEDWLCIADACII